MWFHYCSLILSGHCFPIPIHHPCSLSASSPTLQITWLLLPPSLLSLPIFYSDSDRKLMVSPLWPWTSSVPSNVNDSKSRSLLKWLQVHTLLITDALKKWEICLGSFFISISPYFPSLNLLSSKGRNSFFSACTNCWLKHFLRVLSALTSMIRGKIIENTFLFL